jgi:putative ATP-dependent endonuclease of the OLD family
MQNPFISRVQIKNFRNFLDTDIQLGHKQVVIGENNVGKTNFLRALQLILDKSFSDTDRELIPEDFHDSLEVPMEQGLEILISIEIRGYEHNQKLMAQFTDAVISDEPPTLKFTYKYYPNFDQNKNILNYKYLIFKGNNENYRFTNEDRNFININVIRALRDVERELKANKNSPLYKLVKQYDISSEHLDEISEELKKAAEGIVELDEIVHIKDSLSDQFKTLSGLQTETEINLRPFDIDTERLLYSLQVYMGMKERPISELSMGLANVLYISLMLLLLKDNTILPILKPDQFENLLERDKNGILSNYYHQSEKGNFILKPDLEPEQFNELYQFMDEYNFKHQSFTILAIEEPEAHLHPSLQRLIYREVLHNSKTSVIFTSHSTHITAVTPLESIVHIRRIDNSSKIFSTINLKISSDQKKDIERYIDAKRGEIYFGKGIILVEGISEEYILPSSANLLNKSLDAYGIVVSNINSTNFKPYVQLLNALNIPWVILTDGDFYETKIIKDSEGEKEKKIFHTISTNGGNYMGNENIEKLLIGLGILNETQIPSDPEDQDELFNKCGCFIGEYTLEVDIMNVAENSDLEILKSVYENLTNGGKKMQKNFEIAIDKKDFYSALKKIENNIGKGRFSQRLAGEMTASMIPNYIKNSIISIIEKVKNIHE